MTPDETKPHDLARYLTKREDIAKAAMHGILSNAMWMNNLFNNRPGSEFHDVALMAVEQADELIKALNTIKP